MIELFNDIYQVLFISSIVYIIYIIFDVIIKTYARFKLNLESKIIFSKSEKIILWIAISILFSYLI